MTVSCAGCHDNVELPFEFRMAFQPIVDLGAQRIWGYEALVRGVNGESAYSILSQVTEDIRYRFDQASRVMAIKTAGALFAGRDQLHAKCCLRTECLHKKVPGCR